MSENNNTIKHEQKASLIDLTGIVDDMLKGVYRLRIRFLMIILIVTAIYCGYQRMTYTPYYVASSTFTISASISAEETSSYLDNTTANQMAKTFPYILKSGVLNDVVAEDLGVQKIDGTISADVMSDTNLFTLNVRSGSPAMAEKILKSVVKNYPTVAEFVIGSTKLSLMDETGTPTAPANPFSWKHELFIGVAIGLFICLLIDLLYAFGRNTVQREDDFKKMFSIKSLGVLPQAKFNKRRTETEELVVLDNVRLPKVFLESTRTIRRRIERSCKEHNIHSFLITSAMPGEGKSTVAANVALSLSMKGYKVILVDADLRNPSTAKILGMEEQKIGTLEVMKGEVPYQEAAQRYKDTNVMFLAGSTPIQDTASVLSGEYMKRFIKELEENADYVIIDTPPSALLSDAAIVAQYVEGAVFVVRQDYTDVDRIVDGMEILASSKVHISGCVLNYAPVRGPGIVG
ncbi:MAG: polysaccharide biosynthesis tyrosine autokinase [Anaerostipes sp.]|nr:polysaccharide biosynthesis tyrosine autokinase [Anaerostipes sp.]